MKLLSILIISIFIFSCNKEKGPEDVLGSYVNKSFKGSIEKDDFKDYFAGDLLTEYEGLDEEVLGKLNKIKNQKKKSFKVNFQRCDQDKCFLTYTLIYEAEAAGDATVESNTSSFNSDVTVKVKKIAELRKIDNLWKIYGISDIKTHFDYKELK